MERADVFGKKQYKSENTDRIIAESGSKFTGKVFLYMFFAIAITAVATLGFGAILRGIFANPTNENIGSLFTAMIVMGIAYIPLMIWIQVSILRGGKGIIPAFVIYAIFMGALISPLIAILSDLNMMEIVGSAFGLTCASFGIMALIAWTSKKNLSNLAVIGYGFLSGACMIALFTLILSLFGVQTALLDGLVSAGFFIFVILVTIVDLYNIRRIAARGETSTNLAMVCAFSLYTDFVYVFIRILYYLIRIAAILGLSRRN